MTCNFSREEMTTQTKTKKKTNERSEEEEGGGDGDRHKLKKFIHLLSDATYITSYLGYENMLTKFN